jgi:hypothetical protein
MKHELAEIYVFNKKEVFLYSFIIRRPGGLDLTAYCEEEDIYDFIEEYKKELPKGWKVKGLCWAWVNDTWDTD